MVNIVTREVVRHHSRLTFFRREAASSIDLYGLTSFLLLLGRLGPLLILTKGSPRGLFTRALWKGNSLVNDDMLKGMVLGVDTLGEVISLIVAQTYRILLERMFIRHLLLLIILVHEASRVLLVPWGVTALLSLRGLLFCLRGNS